MVKLWTPSGWKEGTITRQPVSERTWLRDFATWGKSYDQHRKTWGEYAGGIGTSPKPAITKTVYDIKAGAAAMPWEAPEREDPDFIPSGVSIERQIRIPPRTQARVFDIIGGERVDVTDVRVVAPPRREPIPLQQLRKERFERRIREKKEPEFWEEFAGGVLKPEKETAPASPFEWFRRAQVPTSPWLAKPGEQIEVLKGFGRGVVAAPLFPVFLGKSIIEGKAGEIPGAMLKSVATEPRGFFSEAVGAGLFFEGVGAKLKIPSKPVRSFSVSESVYATTPSPKGPAILSKGKIHIVSEKFTAWERGIPKRRQVVTFGKFESAAVKSPSLFMGKKGGISFGYLSETRAEMSSILGKVKPSGKPIFEGPVFSVISKKPPKVFGFEGGKTVLGTTTATKQTPYIWIHKIPKTSRIDSAFRYKQTLKHELLHRRYPFLAEKTVERMEYLPKYDFITKGFKTIQIKASKIFESKPKMVGISKKKGKVSYSLGAAGKKDLIGGISLELPKGDPFQYFATVTARKKVGVVKGFHRARRVEKGGILYDTSLGLPRYKLKASAGREISLESIRGTFEKLEKQHLKTIRKVKTEPAIYPDIGVGLTSIIAKPRTKTRAALSIPSFRIRTKEKIKQPPPITKVKRLDLEITKTVSFPKITAIPKQKARTRTAPRIREAQIGIVRGRGALDVGFAMTTPKTFIDFPDPFKPTKRKKGKKAKFKRGLRIWPLGPAKKWLRLAI
jgi:hypothetical protein